MAITSSAKKAHRQAARRRVFNLRRTRTLKDETKSFEKLVKTGDAKNAQTKLSEVYQAIDKAVKRGIIKKNTGARQKSRVARLLGKGK